jgi:hypothetical protein
MLRSGILRQQVIPVGGVIGGRLPRRRPRRVIAEVTVNVDVLVRGRYGTRGTRRIGRPAGIRLNPAAGRDRAVRRPDDLRVPAVEGPAGVGRTWYSRGARGSRSCSAGRGRPPTGRCAVAGPGGWGEPGRWAVTGARGWAVARAGGWAVAGAGERLASCVPRSRAVRPGTNRTGRMDGLEWRRRRIWPPRLTGWIGVARGRSFARRVRVTRRERIPRPDPARG